MTSFTADWLALREPADHAARNCEILDCVRRHFADRQELSVVDLGSGTGSNLRGCALSLPVERQHWTLVDRDPALLAAARRCLREWADEADEEGKDLVIVKDGKTIAVTLRQADLYGELDLLFDSDTDLVTAAALFDLVSAAWISELVAAIGVRRLPLYTVLSYDGHEEWTPPHAADQPIRLAFLEHQRRDKGFGPAAGRDAVQVLVDALGAACYEVRIGDSPWRLGPASAPLVAQLAQGIARAAIETGEIDERVAGDWSASRADAAGEAGALAVVGHRDLWAAPV